jgi:hypothetical protein
MDILKSYSGLGWRDVRGTNRHVHWRLMVDILRFYNGLGVRDVHGTKRHVHWRLRVDILRFYDGLGVRDVHGLQIVNKWLKPNGQRSSKIEERDIGGA